MDLVAYAVPFFIAAMLFELLWGFWRGKNTYRVNDAVASLFLGTLSQARRFVILGIGGAVYHLIATHFGRVQLDPSSPWTWVFAMVLYDFCYYWLHRLGHERTILWAAHVAHHQSEDYNLSTALRQTSTGFLLGWIFYIPMYLAGIPAQVVVTVGSINLIYQFWVHTQHVGKLGWFEWIFVSPSNHRVHHAQNDLYVDRNYGGLFIIWDRLFGTFQEERDEEPPIYGIRGPIHSFNPLKALTHIYLDMFRDAWRAARWRDKLHVFVARTGWRPPDVAAADRRPKPDLSRFQRYDPNVGKTTRIYALFQLFAVVGLLGYLQLSVGLSYGGAVFLVALMAGTMVCTAFWLEGRSPRLSLSADGARVFAVGIALWWSAPGMSTAEIGLVAAYLVANLAFIGLLGAGESRTREDTVGAGVAG